MAKQLKLDMFKGRRGGLRPNCGRWRLHSKGVAHRMREPIKRLSAVHINFKVSTYIQNRPCLEILHRAFENAGRHGINIVYFAVQSNHVHLIAEVSSAEVLTKSMRSLTITFAKGLKQLKNIEGSIQLERYHLHPLKTPAEIQNAVHYVRYNETHHSGRSPSKEFTNTLNGPVSFLLKSASLS